jgi:hypothetical protein
MGENSLKNELSHIKQLKRMEFKDEILMNIYRSITLTTQSISAPLLGSASTQAK